MRRWLPVAVAFQVVLVLVAIGDRLLPRLTGDEYRILVQPIDPIDPFRGAYVDLAYGDLASGGDGEKQDVWVPLRREGDHWVARRPTRRRPDGPAMRCTADNDVRCGIESFFASQDEARRLERVLAEGAVARVKIDGAGRAAIVGLEDR